MPLKRLIKEIVAFSGVDMSKLLKSLYEAGWSVGCDAELVWFVWGCSCWEAGAPGAVCGGVLSPWAAMEIVRKRRMEIIR